MVIFVLATILSLGYAGCYAVHCAKEGRKGAAAAMLALCVLPLALCATLVYIIFGSF